MTVIPLYKGDAQCPILLERIVETIREHGNGLSIPAILGVLDLTKDYVKADALKQPKP